LQNIVAMAANKCLVAAGPYEPVTKYGGLGSQDIGRNLVHGPDAPVTKLHGFESRVAGLTFKQLAQQQKTAAIVGTG
jgi:hypothetical protein